MLQQYDENHNGQIEFTEFEHYVQRRRGAIEKAFDKLDADKSGSISERELVSAQCAQSNHTSVQACWEPPDLCTSPWPTADIGKLQLLMVHGQLAVKQYQVTVASLSKVCHQSRAAQPLPLPCRSKPATPLLCYS